MRQRSDRLIRLIGAFKLVKAALLVAVGIGAIAMSHHSEVADTVHAIRPSGRWIDQMIGKLIDVSPHHLAALGVGSLVYASVFVVEGIGLLRRRRWAEYMTVIVTISFIPLEVYEMIEKSSLLKAGVILINIGVVIYLIWRLRQENQDMENDATPRSRRTPASSDVAPV